MNNAVDAVTFEIIRHRLNQVIEEAIVALENVSGSPITNEGHDMMVSLYRADGGLMVGGMGFLHHLTSAAQAVKHILATYSEDPGIDQDDVFMLNDSYTAALHPPDVYLISPVHYQGRLTGFVGNFVHMTDIGAIDPGGFSPNAREAFQEGFVTQGLKIVERGRRRRDVIETFLRNVRDPGMTGLDLKSQLAANHVAKERLRKLYDDYGVQAVDQVSEELIRQSERLMRERLRELPDGVWRARQYVDMPEGLYRVELAAIKEGDTLTYDFTGTDPQVDKGINSCYWGSWGGIFAPIFPLLAWDVGWNEGVTKPIRIIAPEGTLVNCIRPAPVSVATTGVIQIVNNLSVNVLSRILGASERYRDRATGVWHGSHLPLMISGLDEHKDYFVTLLTDTFAGAGGARAFADGVDNGGEIPNVVSRWANVETEELHRSIAYLYRSPVPDSGGPGKYRGGVNHEFAFTPHDTGTGAIHLGLTSKGLKVPLSLGIFGGLPGSTIAQLIFRKANLEDMPTSFTETRGEKVEAVHWGDYSVSEGDIVYIRFQGGGGYGDPIDRDPERTLRDVQIGMVSPAAAHAIYGVVLDPANARVDHSETRARRAKIRHERIGHPVAAELYDRGNIPPSHQPLGEYLQQVGDAKSVFVQCTWCGHELSRAGEQWKDKAIARALPISAAGDFRDAAPGLIMRQFYCPRCATLLDTEVVLESDPPLYDDVRRWPRPENGNV
ncbi:MAG: hydantoinase B/oxoprolinase family protein [Candidatus Binataceae bacterium]|nr:hydantoinase B/oxoprolinase family protein [Candidatus Binataceae bacterium]